MWVKNAHCQYAARMDGKAGDEHTVDRYKADTGRIWSAIFQETKILSIFAATCLIKYNIKFPFCKEYSFQEIKKQVTLQIFPWP